MYYDTSAVTNTYSANQPSVIQIFMSLTKMIITDMVGYSYPYWYSLPLFQPV